MRTTTLPLCAPPYSLWPGECTCFWPRFQWPLCHTDGEKENSSGCQGKVMLRTGCPLNKMCWHCECMPGHRLTTATPSPSPTHTPFFKLLCVTMAMPCLDSSHCLILSLCAISHAFPFCLGLSLHPFFSCSHSPSLSPSSLCCRYRSGNHFIIS